MHMGLLAVLLVALGLGPTAAEHAALLQVRGDTAAARAAADTILGKHPGDASALFVAACAALESGELDVASEYTAQLERGRSIPQAAVLRRLIERRRSSTEEPLREALVTAWKEAGHPDLSAEPLLRATESWGELLPPFDPKVRSRLTASERFIFDTGGPATTPAYVKAAILASAETEQNPLAVNLEILAALTPPADVGGVDRSSAARVAAAHVGRVVVAADPDNGYLALAATLASIPGYAPLDSQDLAGIERALQKPRFEYPRDEAMRQFREIAVRIDPRHGELRAWSAALGGSIPLYRLWKRAELVEDGELRVRAGRVLQDVGKRFRNAGTTLEYALSVMLEQKGAQLSGDAAAVDAVRVEVTRWSEWRQSAERARKRMGNWPFAAVWREGTPSSEVAQMRKLVE
jgi:hypothetical protein